MSESQDLVVSSKELVLDAKRPVVVNSDVQSWLQKTGTGEAVFSSVVGSSDWHKPDELHSFLTLASGTLALPVFIASAGWGMIAPGEAFLGTIAILLLGAPAVGGATYGTLRWLVNGKFLARKKLASQVHQVNKKGLDLWLKSRYQITVEDKTLDALATAVDKGVTYDHEAGVYIPNRFKDLEGNEWYFKKETGTIGWFVAPVESRNLHSESPQRQVRKPAAITPPEKAALLFSDEVKTLLSKIELRMSILSKCNLNVESQYELEQVSRDTQQALASFQRLNDLNDDEQPSDTVLVEVLQVLNSQLKATLAVETDDAHNELIIQREYLLDKARRSGTSKTDLTLEP